MATRKISDYFVISEINDDNVKFSVTKTNGSTFECILKWSGSSKFDFLSNDFSFSNLKEFQSFSTLIEGLYEWASELVPEHKTYYKTCWKG